MEVKKIYFDMDGVLADFDRGIAELCHLTPRDQRLKTPEWEATMFGAMREVGHFYDKLQPVEGMVEVLNLLLEKYGDKIEILSGVPKPNKQIETAADDKRSWMRRIFDERIVCNLVYREEKKAYCQGRDCILVDDFDKNTVEWENAGGTAILFTDAEALLAKLQELGIL